MQIAHNIEDNAVRELIMREFEYDHERAAPAFPSREIVRITTEEFEEMLDDLDLEDVYKKIEETPRMTHRRFVYIYSVTLELIEQHTEFDLVNLFLYKSDFRTRQDLLDI